MMQNVIQARIEANEGQIESMSIDNAKDAGITVDEWKRLMLERNNYEPEIGIDDNSDDR